MTQAPKIYWADLHNHNAVGYGQGTLERSYHLARTLLDVYALSVHGYWPDPPQNDPKLAAYHIAEFDKVSAAFPGVVSAANRYNEPGRFVAFAAYEWHSAAWGDYVVIFPGGEGELHRALSLQELQQFVRQRGGIMIPHHVGYRAGWRGLDWSSVDPALSPLIEVFSEHGNSFEREGPWPMLQHSMGGVTTSQTVTEQLQRGAHFGFTAGTDTHFGYPGSHGEGITGIYARELSRDAIFNALRNRHTFAGTGDRIEVRVDSGGALPGDLLPASAERKFELSINPLAPLDYVEVIKNGHRCKVWPVLNSAATDVNETYLVRVEWGWGRMDSADDTDWTIKLEVHDGALLRVIPCLGGGAASVAKFDSIRTEENAVRVASVTSRRNPFPISGVVLEFDGNATTRIVATIQAALSTEQGEVTLSARVGELREDDCWAAVLPRFSSPRLRFGRAHAKRSLQFARTFEDPAPGGRDTYVFKARQGNGHTVWTSPYSFADDSSGRAPSSL